MVGAGFTGLWTALQAKERDRGHRRWCCWRAARPWPGRVRPQRRDLLGQPDPRRGQRPGPVPAEFATLQRLGAENLDAIEAAVRRYGIDCGFERTAPSPWPAEYQVAALREDAEQDGVPSGTARRYGPRSTPPLT